VFGISTHLTVSTPLDREHLVDIAAHGFERVELFASRNHFDYADERRLAELGEWLSDTRLTLASCHAPIAAEYAHGGWRDPYSLAAADDARRRRAVDETLAVLNLAGVVPYRTLVLHAGTTTAAAAADNSRAAMVRSLTDLAPAAADRGVRLAVEVIPNGLSTPASLVALIEGLEDVKGLGICVDVGHARLMGDVVDAIETCSGHIVTTHLHDNRGRTDDHLIPGQGVIDWDASLLSFQKVGFDGPWIFELAVSDQPRAALEKAVKARERFESLLRISDEMIE
jgi:sugar phosphate isomerase/epimerase